MPTRRFPSRGSGFTLAELAVALVILALLLAGALIPISTQMELKNTADTQRTLDQIRESVIGFALVNGRLPCPATGLVASASASAGTEQWDSINNRCSTNAGVVPWVTLAVPETDAWGRRFSYRVSPIFADAPAAATWQTDTSPPLNAVLGSYGTQNPTCAPVPAPASASFALCSLGDIAVLTRNDSSHTVYPLGTGIPAVIVSHGKNGWGAYMTSGAGRYGVGVSGDSNGDGVPDQNADEAANLLGIPTGAPSGTPTYTQYLYYSRTPTTGASGCSDATAGSAFCEYDDLLVWIPTAALISRAVSAGRLP